VPIEELRRTSVRTEPIPPTAFQLLNFILDTFLSGVRARTACVRQNPDQALRRRARTTIAREDVSRAY
jgi:hypothetical protein